MWHTLFFLGLSLLGAGAVVGRAADLKDSFLSISDLVGGAAAGGGTPPVGLWPVENEPWSMTILPGKPTHSET